MKLLTTSIREQLLRNGRLQVAPAEEGNAEADFLPAWANPDQPTATRAHTLGLYGPLRRWPEIQRTRA